MRHRCVAKHPRLILTVTHTSGYIQERESTPPRGNIKEANFVLEQCVWFMPQTVASFCGIRVYWIRWRINCRAKCSIWVLSPALPKCQRNLFTLNYNYDSGLVITSRNNFQSAIWSFSVTSILYLVSSGCSPLLSQAVVVQRHSRLRTLIVDLLPLFAATRQRNEAPKLGPQLIAA